MSLLLHNDDCELITHNRHAHQSLTRHSPVDTEDAATSHTRKYYVRTGVYMCGQVLHYSVSSQLQGNRAHYFTCMYA